MYAPVSTTQRQSYRVGDEGIGLGQPARAGGALPPLSRTYRSSQMHTPRYLERVTIDDPR